jgi:hypothetical protein
MLFKIQVMAIIIILAFNRNLSAQTAAGLEALCRQYKPYAIDISSLRDFYETLPADEKEEQLRDWAYYGLLISLNIQPSEINCLTGMDFPMRYQSLKEKFKFTVSPGRSSNPYGNDCVMLVPESGAENKFLEGYIFDRQIFTAGQTPKTVNIFAYSPAADGKAINIYFVRSVAGSAFLSVEYGYFEKEVTGSAELKEFMKSTDDISSVKVGAGSLILAGRKNKLGEQASLTFEDVAVLYQAYLNPVPAGKEQERRKSYDVFLSQKYNEIVSKDKKLKRAIKSGKIKYKEIMAKIRHAFPYTPLDNMDSNVGFSLDPIYDYGALAAEMNELAGKTGKFADIAKDMAVLKAIDIRSRGIKEAAGKVKAQRSITPLLKFRRGLVSGNDIGDLQLDSALQQVELDNTYQIARYDGRVKGTSAAMILFYTDLTAKLWALDYNGTSPKNAVTGFKALSEVKVPKLYWRDFVKLSKTRLWFGLRGDSFDINGDEILFEPVSARVYAASSDPLYPGKETRPNYQSGQFLGWWDDHYSAVADYEPYYYKLNELLKWSCVMMVLKEKKSHCLDFLRDEPVTRTYDFESWYKNNAGLKSKTDLPYVDRSRFNRAEECFKILQSKGYPLMGATYFVSGGVSLASKKDIADKLSKHTQDVSGAGVRASRVKAKRGGNECARRPSDGKKYIKAPVPEPVTNNYGEFSAAAQERSLKLDWNRNEGAVLEECVNTLVAVQARAGREGRNESIFKTSKDFQKVVRLELGKTYLIRHVSLKEKWIYVSVDPDDGKTEGFPVKAAGTEPETSVFYAKAIPAYQAEKLIEQSKGVTIVE